MPTERSAEQRQILKIAEELATEFEAVATETDREGKLPVAHYERAHEVGYMRLTLPRKYGGWEADVHTFCLAQEILARGCAGTALAACMHLSVQANLSFMLSPEQRDAAFGDAVARRVTFAGGGTEEGTGGSWSWLSSRARRTDSGYVLNARKRFCSGASRADFFYVFAGVDAPAGSEAISNVSAFLIPRDTPGLKVEQTWDSMGMRASGSDDLVLQDCEVPESALVGRSDQGFAHATKWLYWFLFGETATYLGVASAALDHAVEYVKDRHRKYSGTRLAPTFDRQLAIGKMATELEAARAFLHQEALVYSEPAVRQRGYTSRLLARAAMAKFNASEVAVRVTDEALKIVGGFGYLREGPFERHYRDARGGPFHPPRNHPTALALAGQLKLGINLDPHLASGVAAVEPK